MQEMWARSLCLRVLPAGPESAGEETQAQLLEEGEPVNDNRRAEGPDRDDADYDEEAVRAGRGPRPPFLFLLLLAPAGSRPTSML